VSKRPTGFDHRQAVDSLSLFFAATRVLSLAGLIMSKLLMIPVVLALVVAAHVAHAAECDDRFGKHPLPPAPLWAPLVDDLPYGRFEWGTDASTDPYDRWWRLNVVRNGDAAPLVINWDKGGIFFGSPNPLPVGQRHCQWAMLSFGQQLTPVLDRDAPILYSSNRRQDAAVYVENIQAGTAPGQGPSDRPQKNVSAVTSVGTVYRDERGVDRSVSVTVDSEGNSGKFSMVVETSQKELIIGISDIVDTLGSEQLGAVRRDIQRQGATLELSTLANFVGSESVKQLFWSSEKLAPSGQVMFLSGGYPKVQLFFDTPADVGSQKRPAMLIILDPAKRAISADRITLIVPKASR
jgi:hypothetical protein